MKIDGDYTSIELDQNGKVVFIGGNSKLREELNLHPVSSDVSSKTQPFQGKKLRFIDGYWQGIKDGGSEYVDDLKEMVQNPFDIAINLVDLIKAVKEDPTLASEIGEAKLNEWSDIVHNVVHGSQVERGRELGHLTVNILSILIPAGNVGKAAKLSKLSKWASVFKNAEKTTLLHIPQVGNKLEYVFGKATGNLHNIQRSVDLQRKVNSIGIYDNENGRKIILDALSRTLNDKTSIKESLRDGRTLRESLLVGPQGVLKMETIWDGEKLITVKILGSK